MIAVFGQNGLSAEDIDVFCVMVNDGLVKFNAVTISTVFCWLTLMLEL